MPLSGRKENGSSSPYVRGKITGWGEGLTGNRRAGTGGGSMEMMQGPRVGLGGIKKLAQDLSSIEVRE